MTELSFSSKPGKSIDEDTDPRLFIGSEHRASLSICFVASARPVLIKATISNGPKLELLNATLKFTAVVKFSRVRLRVEFIFVQIAGNPNPFPCNVDSVTYVSEQNYQKKSGKCPALSF